jgi:two-component system OmpR family response regulator
MNEPAQPTERRQRRVLVVDGHPESGHRLAQELRKIGHHAEHAICANTALNIAGKLKPEIVFLDVLLPDFEGPALSQLLRLLLDPDSLRVVAIGHSEAELRRRALLAGCEQALLKPLNLEEVQRQLA